MDAVGDSSDCMTWVPGNFLQGGDGFDDGDLEDVLLEAGASGLLRGEDFRGEHPKRM